MDAFTFIRDTTDSWIDDLLSLAASGKSEVRYAAALTGRFDALAVLECRDLDHVEDVVFKHLRGHSTTETSIALSPSTLRRTQWHPHEAIVRIWVESGRADSVRDALEKIDGVEGPTLVSADWDIIALVGAPSFDDLTKRLVGEVHTTSGIARSSTAFITAATHKNGQHRLGRREGRIKLP